MSTTIQERMQRQLDRQMIELATIRQALSASQAREAAALERIHQFDVCIQAIAKSLGSPACGGVDMPVSDPHGTAGVLVAAVDALHLKLAEQQASHQRVRQLMVRVHNKLSGTTKDPSLFNQIDEELQEGGWDDDTELRKLLEAKVPEALFMPDANWKGDVDEATYKAGWNDCRAAMLSQPPKEPTP